MIRRRKGLRFNRRYRRGIELSTIQKRRLFIISIIVAVMIAAGGVFSFGKKITVTGSGMSPTMKEGETVLLNRLSYRLQAPKRGDIAVIASEGADEDHYSIKRIVAVGGDTIKVENHYLYVNGKKYSDTGTSKIASTYIDNPGVIADKVKVPEGKYFILGDNPDASEDSRFSNIGMIEKKNIIGGVWFRISPLSRMEIIN